MTKLNTGLSGCSLELINDRVLRKYSPTTDYNSRLLSQADKQVVFGNRIYKNNSKIIKFHKTVQSSQ